MLFFIDPSGNAFQRNFLVIVKLSFEYLYLLVRHDPNLVAYVGAEMLVVGDHQYPSGEVLEGVGEGFDGSHVQVLQMWATRRMVRVVTMVRMVRNGKKGEEWKYGADRVIKSCDQMKERRREERVNEGETAREGGQRHREGGS